MPTSSEIAKATSTLPFICLSYYITDGIEMALLVTSVLENFTSKNIP